MNLADGILTLGLESFRDQICELNEPALVSDGLRDSPAIENWSPDTLRSLNAGRLVDLDVSQSGIWVFRPLADPTQQYRMKDVPFERACDLISNASARDPKYYISHLNICQKLPALHDDLHFPFCLDPDRAYLWFGCADTVTRLHCDIDNNLFGQVYGSKKITLFSPEDSSLLYQYPLNSVTPHFSFVDVEEPDLARYPLYRNARKKTVTVLPGQLLFIPAGWWHHVRAMEVSISITEWLTPTLLQRAVPSLLWFLLGEFKRDGWAQLLGHPISLDALLDAANKLVQFNPSAATLAAAVAVDNSKITGDADAQIASQVSAIRDELCKLVASLVQEPNAAISSASVAEMIGRIRLLSRGIAHST